MRHSEENPEAGKNDGGWGKLKKEILSGNQFHLIFSFHSCNCPSGSICCSGKERISPWKTAFWQVNKFLTCQIVVVALSQESIQYFCFGELKTELKYSTKLRQEPFAASTTSLQLSTYLIEKQCSVWGKKNHSTQTFLYAGWESELQMDSRGIVSHGSFFTAIPLVLGAL